VFKAFSISVTFLNRGILLEKKRAQYRLLGQILTYNSGVAVLHLSKWTRRPATCIQHEPSP